MWDEAHFLSTDNFQSFLQVDATVFCRRGQACPDSQPNCKVLKSAISQKGPEGLPRFLAIQRPLSKFLKIPLL